MIFQIYFRQDTRYHPCFLESHRHWKEHVTFTFPCRKPDRAQRLLLLIFEILLICTLKQSSCSSVHPGLQKCLRILLLRSKFYVKSFGAERTLEMPHIIATISPNNRDTLSIFSKSAAFIIIPAIPFYVKIPLSFPLNRLLKSPTSSHLYVF